MDNRRRKFLKLAGLTAAAGVAVPMLGSRTLAQEHGGGHGAPAAHGNDGHEAAPTGVRQGIVIDTGKFHDNPGLAEKCQKVCHDYHNVPKFPNSKDEI
ncbi:MAG: twin-arginine translocation signal domain-containing protein, partial [Deltaproteobacteria bacterium]|nr:twin-arginine translocation signal domain-containing protein [Deltaproteobacteria bacterium]